MSQGMTTQDLPLGGDDRLDLLTRLCFTPLAVATALFGPILLILPGKTADYWAWPIQPDMSAIWIGSAYTFGAVALMLMLLQGRWTSALIPVASTLPFAVVMLAATLIHNDRFSHGTPQYYVWLLIYIALPIVLPCILLLNRRRRQPPHPGELVLPRRLRTAFIAAGLAAALIGLELSVAPDAIRDSWPWQLTPLMARVVGGWLLFLATGGLAAAFERRYAAYRFYLPAAAFWFAMLLVASIAHNRDFRSDSLSTFIYFGAVCIAIAALLGVFVFMERRAGAMRSGISASQASGASRNHPS